MSDLKMARCLGICVLIVGFCCLAIADFSIGGLLLLILSTAFALIKIAFTIVALGFTAVGCVWTLRPGRAIDTIKRNNEHRALVKKANEDA